MKGSAANYFKDYHLLHFPGEVSGYIVETGEKRDYGNIENFHASLLAKTHVNKDKLSEELKVTYKTLQKEQLIMEYVPEKLRCKASINGKKIIWDQLTDGAVYESPFLKVKDGRMEISNGREGYIVEFYNDIPVWKEIIK
jgi:hypothetical protein